MSWDPRKTWPRPGGEHTQPVKTIQEAPTINKYQEAWKMWHP